MKSTMKTKMGMKVLSWVLALAMSLSMGSAGKLAASAEGTSGGSELVFDAGALAVAEKGTLAEGQELVSGDFTVLCHNNTAILEKSVSFEDGYTSTKRLALGGTLKTSRAAIKFTTDSAAEVTVYWVSGGDGREIKIIDAGGVEKAITSVNSVKNTSYISTLSLAEAGTFYLGSSDSSNYIFKIIVKQSAGSGETTPVFVPETYVLTGSYGFGLDEDEVQLPEISFTALGESKYNVPAVSFDTAAKTYSIVLEKETGYEMGVSGMVDYWLKAEIPTIQSSEDMTFDLVYEKKPCHPITINLTSETDLTGQEIVYRFMHEDGTVYEFTDVNAVELRDGKYKVSIGGAAEYSIRSGENLIVSGNAVSHEISVMDPDAEVKNVEQAVMPYVPGNDKDANTGADTDGIPRQNKPDTLTVQPVGQKLKLSQTGGSFADKFADTADVAYYLFPKTADLGSTLKFDLIVTESKATGNTAGFFGGMFTDNYVYSLGLRAGGQKIRGIYSKNGGLNGGSFAGAGSPSEEVVGLNRLIHYDICYNGSTGKPEVNITFVDDNGEVQTRSWTQAALTEPDGSTPKEFYFGFALANISATITNMVYTDGSGAVLYDQNACYYTEGVAPVADSVSVMVADTREYIDITWTGTVPDCDGTYVVEMQKDGGEWMELTQDATGFDYRYTLPAGDGGNYAFRVCGQLGKATLGGSRNDYVTTSEPVYVVAALGKPEVSVTATATDITLSWDVINGAEYYQVYRYSFDEGEAGAVCVADKLAETSYQDINVVAETPYYYQVMAVSESTKNQSPLSDTVWQVPTAGHVGGYVYEEDATEIFITKKSYDTVFSDKVLLEGNVYGEGTLAVVVNGESVATKDMAARDAFSFELTVVPGRNDVNLLFTDIAGNVTGKTYNFVYLTNYDYMVDASYTGTDGEAVNGIPTYKTVQAAVNAVPTDNADSKVILVLAGSYEERLEISNPYITLIGEDRENTLIHCYPGALGAGYEAGGNTDKRCATIIKETAVGFTAENISFANDYVYGTEDGKSNKAADAIRVEADNSLFVNVKFMGVQDTLYLHSGKQYYHKCVIEGLVDFIYSGEKARAFFNDCEICFVYEPTKTSGYVCAPKTAADAAYGLTFYNCVITGEEGCSGSGYLLARPWGPDAYITWINCYMGKVLNELAPYGDMSGNMHENARFYEFGTFGPGFAINEDRRQISPAKAEEMVSAQYLGWEPGAVAAVLSAEHYVGNIVTGRAEQYADGVAEDNTYLWTEGDDSGLKMYDMEGYADAYGVTGGGLLKESNENYYKVGTAIEFLDVLLAVKNGGKNSVIELTADINLGCNEIENFAGYKAVVKAYNAQPLTHPTLIKSGVSVLTFDKINNLTIFSANEASIKHANITMKNSENIIIRNIKFDELWEWDEATSGDYDRNDWDYMTIDSGCNGIWIDHCTFYKAYDGIVDVKNPAPINNVTISWCEFLPGSENNTFFDEMMKEIYANPDKYPTTYQKLKAEGMTEEQIYMYAYGVKKTHLLGQSDDAVNAAGIRVTLANNYYLNCMDRMPRLRYGNSHVYNCIMDAQELLDVRLSIANEDIAKKIVSNGASSTCEAQVLLENCYINGIQNVLNSGNGSSPSGYINAINSLYYMGGVQTEFAPKCNTSGDTRVLITDADAFKSNLPYSGYVLYDADKLDGIVNAYAGAGKLELTALQWEKTSYNAEWQEPVAKTDVPKQKPSEIPVAEATAAPTTEPTKAPTTEPTKAPEKEDTSKEKDDVKETPAEGDADMPAGDGSTGRMVAVALAVLVVVAVVVVVVKGKKKKK